MVREILEKIEPQYLRPQKRQIIKLHLTKSYQICHKNQLRILFPLISQRSSKTEYFVSFIDLIYHLTHTT